MILIRYVISEDNIKTKFKKNYFDQLYELLPVYYTDEYSRNVIKTVLHK